ncbi:MAG: histone deacetylase [Candidatus Omnitrophica bacterium]|nr:histone deacetylase [Candidatus Omnitrophota bacterium]
MKIIYSPKCLDYCETSHPESPRRVRESFLFLKEKGFEFEEPGLCNEADLLLVHEEGLIEKVKNGNFFEADTPDLPGIYEYAKLSVAAAILAMETALKGGTSFSLMRPPGHHATKRRLGGFCYFNNLAIAVKKALSSVKRIAIVDLDGHHGNGTQDIFLGEERVVYLSLHQFPAYPGTGAYSFENCFNFPLSPGTGEKKYLEALAEALEKVKKFNPELIAVSAGFDTAKGDPLLQLNLFPSSYEKSGKELASLGRPIFSILEGGYSRELPKCIYRYLQGLIKEES